MNEKKIKFRDPVVERVVDKFVSRSDVGYDKYGKTLHDERTGGHKDLLGYLNDIQEELMDVLIIPAILQCICYEILLRIKLLSVKE